MRVLYQSALVNKELTRGSVFRTTPCRACLVIETERNEPDFDLIYNGVVVDSSITSFDCDADAELIVRQHGEKYSYSVKPIVHTLSNEYALAYEQFAYEHMDKTQNEIKSIQSGQLKMYAVDQSAEVHDWTELFNKLEIAFPAFKSICEKPKSHLKAVNEVRPIETVKRIGYESIPYLAAHSEDWLARTASGLKPARLFSRVEDDEFQIYENRVTKTLIDLILSFLRKKEKELKDQYEQLHGIMNSGVQVGSFGFDVTFQKAVAELMSSDEKGDEHRSKVLDLVQKFHEQSRYLLKKYRTLRQTRLYRYLKKSKGVTNPLNETNILLMDKHYNVVFKLWKDIHKEIAPQEVNEENAVKFSDTLSDYLLFCKILCGYTAHVLNFNIEQDGLYSRKDDNLALSVSETDGLISVTITDKTKRYVDLENGVLSPIMPGETFGKFSFDGVRLYWENDASVDEIEKFCSLFKTRESRGKEQAEEKKKYSAIKSAIDQRQRTYSQPKYSKIVIWPAAIELESDTRNTFKEWVELNASNIAETYHADYVIIAVPVCGEDEQKIISYAKGNGANVMILPLTMFDINSFRRLQNVMLRQIVSLNTGHCPCCGGEMRGRDNQMVCDNCNQMMLTKTICPNPDCRHEYYYLSFDVSAETLSKMKDVDPDNFYQVDSLYQYKDIVNMSVDTGKIRTICPHCGQ